MATHLREMTTADWERAMIEHPELQQAFSVRLTAYIPIEPTPKQRAFLWLPHREAFFGGACAGGKSSALLMGALQYANIPGYSAIIFRKTLSDAKQPGGLIAKSLEWLSGTDAVWKQQEHCWYFPSGARLQFGFLDSELDCYRYQSAEFSYIAFDEASQFFEDDYVYLLSRLRAPRCPDHPTAIDPECRTCQQYGPISQVPLRFRAASNPGGRGARWIKERYSIGPIEGQVGPTGRQLYGGQNSKRPYIGAYIHDNPFIDTASYSETLRELDPVTREQLLAGDWGVSEEGRFRRSWARYYEVVGSTLQLDSQSWPLNKCSTFCIIDPAATTRSTPGKTEIYRRQGSWTVVATFKRTPRSDLIIWDVSRGQWELPQITREIRTAVNKHRPQFVGLELTAVSSHLFQMLQHEGLNMRAFRPGTQDKVARSVDAANRMEQGQVWLPRSAPWLPAFEDELFTWVGDPRQTDDQIDVLSYAAIHISQTRASSGGAIPMVFPDASGRCG